MSGLKQEPWYWHGVDLFGGTGPDARAAFFDASERHEFRRGETLFRADDPAQRIYYLEQGRVKIFHLSVLGEVTIFWFCVAGDPFGAGAISGAAEQAVFAEALEHSVVYSVSRDRFEQLVREHPQLGINMIKLVSARLRLACDALTERSGWPTEARLARVLMRLGRHWPGPCDDCSEGAVRVTHQELAQMVGSCRQTVSRILNRFARQRLVKLEQRRLVITDAQRLSLIAREERDGTAAAPESA